MSFGDGVVWVRFIDGSVGRIDLTTNALTATIPVGTGEFGSLAVGEDAVWVTTFDTDTVSRIDPTTNAVVAEIAVGTNPEGILVTPEAVWVSNHRAGSISRIDPATNTVVATLQLGKAGRSGPDFIWQALGDLWTAVPNEGLVVRMDPETNEVLAKINVPAVIHVIIGDDTVYALDSLGRLTEIEPASNEVGRPFQPDVMPWWFGLGAFWGAEGSDLLRIDPETFAVTERWQVPGSQTEYANIAFDDASAWLLTNDSLLQVGLAP